MNATKPEANREERYSDCYFRVRDGLNLHYRDYPGSADLPPLLCLPGLTRNARDFAEFAERYSPRFRVIALEFRGRGERDYDPVPQRYNPLTYAADVLQLLDELAIGQAVFVGTSLGGLVTFTIAGTALQRIAASIINDVGPELVAVGIDRILSYVGADERFATWEEAALRLAAMQGDGFPTYTHEDWIMKARRNCRERDGAIVFDYDMAIAEPFKASGPTPKVDLWPLFMALAQKPLLVVRGEISDLLSEATAEKMHQLAPSTRFAVIPATGHAPELTEPAAVAATDEFLQEIARRGSV